MNKQIIDARNASVFLRTADTETRNGMLLKIADKLSENISLILTANGEDVKFAKENGMSEALLDRLTLTEERIKGICSDERKVAALPDPIGEVMDEWTTEAGLKIKKVRVPFGVIGIIYESRPNVTVDVTCLCLKTGNACILKGGKEAAETNAVLVRLMKEAVSVYGNENVIELLPNERAYTEELINAKGYVDLIVPRGGKGLIDYVCSNSLVPVIETGAGVCHIYVEKSADFQKALKILVNAKTSRPSVCNAAETLLVDRIIAKEFLPMAERALKEKGVILRGGEEECKIINAEYMKYSEYNTEYDSLVMSVKIVENEDEAINHILTFGTKHSDCICAENMNAAEKFMNGLDSACVYVNASTRFSDGGCFGFGAELGISTQKLHARGPMGLKEMTSYHYKIYGEGQIR